MKPSLQPTNRGPRTNMQPVSLTAGEAVEAFGLKRILVPTDFSDASLKAFAYAEQIARENGATLYLVYVHERAGFMGGADTLVMEIPDQRLLEQENKHLLSLAADRIDEVVPVKAEVRLGRAFEQITQYAREMSADLIVISTHGYTGLKHVFLGSTAERVVRSAPCPVLVVR